MQKYFFLIFSLFVLSSFSQEMYKVEYIFTDKDGFACPSYLYTNNMESVFKIGDTRKSGEIVNNSGAIDFIHNDELSKFFYTTDKDCFYRFYYSEQEVLYNDDLSNKLNWTINLQNKRKIGIYNCTEATLKLNGRDYSVWFTIDLPIKFGPMKFNKLPGMVIEVGEKNNFLKLQFVKIFKTKKITEFESVKKYILDKKDIINYELYEKNLINYEVAGVLRAKAYGKEHNLDGKVTLNYQYEIDLFLDTPKNLLGALKKAWN